MRTLFRYLKVVIAPYVNSSTLDRYVRRPITVGVLLVACIGAFWIAAFTSKARLHEPLSIVSGELDFGQAWEDQAFRWSIQIENQSGHPLDAVEISATCECTKVEPSVLSLGVGERAVIQATLDLSIPRVRKTPPARGPRVGADETDKRPPTEMLEFEVEIKARCRDMHARWLPVQTWKLHGASRRALSISADAVSFGESLVLGQQFSNRRVLIHANLPLKHISASGNDAFAHLDVRPSPHQADEYELIIQPQNDLPVGENRFDVTINSEADTGEILPIVRIPVEMHIFADIQATPRSINFGACRQGEAVSETMVLQSRSGADFDVTRIDSDSMDISVEEVHCDPAFKCYRVSQKSNDLGQRLAAVRFDIQQKNGRGLIIPVAVRYLGTAD